MVVGVNAAVEALGHALDPRRHPHVGDAHFAHGAVHVGDHALEEIAGEQPRRFALALEAMHHQEGMEGQHLVAAVEGVGHAAGQIEVGQPGLLDHPAVAARNRVLAAGASEEAFQECDHGRALRSPRGPPQGSR